MSWNQEILKQEIEYQSDITDSKEGELNLEESSWMDQSHKVSLINKLNLVYFLFHYSLAEIESLVTSFLS